MKLQEAMVMIKDVINRPKGFRVAFEVKDKMALRSDYFPDRDEEPIPTEEEAWVLAKQFASVAKGMFYNIYVVDETYHPVDEDREYNNRRIYNRYQKAWRQYGTKGTVF